MHIPIYHELYRQPLQHPSHIQLPPSNNKAYLLFPEKVMRSLEAMVFGDSLNEFLAYLLFAPVEHGYSEFRICLIWNLV